MPPEAASNKDLDLAGGKDVSGERSSSTGRHEKSVPPAGDAFKELKLVNGDPPNRVPWPWNHDPKLLAVLDDWRGRNQNRTWVLLETDGNGVTHVATTWQPPKRRPPFFRDVSGWQNRVTGTGPRCLAAFAGSNVRLNELLSVIGDAVRAAWKDEPVFAPPEEPALRRQQGVEIAAQQWEAHAKNYEAQARAFLDEKVVAEAKAEAAEANSAALFNFMDQLRCRLADIVNRGDQSEPSAFKEYLLKLTDDLRRAGR